MKSILCFGDSNTWGWNPADASRYSLDQRWPGMLMKELGPDYYVIEEGLSGRTTMHDDPVEGADKNGLSYLTPCLSSHAPIDLVIVALGANDLKARFSLTAAEIAQGVGCLVEVIRRSSSGPNRTAPQVMIVAPALFNKNTIYMDMFAGGLEKLGELPHYYQAVAQQYECDFLDLALYIHCESLDGMHYDVKDHHTICEQLIPRIKKVIG